MSAQKIRRVLAASGDCFARAFSVSFLVFYLLAEALNLNPLIAEPSALLYLGIIAGFILLFSLFKIIDARTQTGGAAQKFISSLFFMSSVALAFSGFFAHTALNSSRLNTARTILIVASLCSGFFVLRLLQSDKQCAGQNNDNPRQERQPHKEELGLAWFRRRATWHSVGFCLIVVTFLFFALPGLGSYLTVDEPRWINDSARTKAIPTSYEQALDGKFISKTYARSEAYWDAYIHHDFKATFNNANPSATLNFLHLPAYLLKDRLSFGQYMSLARTTIIIHNLILLLVLSCLMRKLTSKGNSLLFFASMALLPQVIGFSRIINHDSIQGLYILGFILSLWIGLDVRQKKYYVAAGIFYSLALFTQYASVFIMPLLFLLPMLHSYIKNDLNDIKHFIDNLGRVYLTAVFSAILILPAVVSYPQLLINRLFFYGAGLLGFVHVLAVLSVAAMANLRHGVDVHTIKDREKYPVIISISALIILFGYIVFRRNEIIHSIMDGGERYHSLFDAIINSYATLFFGLPLVLLVILIIKLYVLAKNRKIDLSFILIGLFFTLIAFAVIQTRGDDGYVLLGGRYLYVFLPILVAGIYLNETLFPKGLLPPAFFALIVILTYANFNYNPFYILYNNALLPKGYLISRTTWASDTGESSKYINSNFEDITIYNPRGRMENLLDKDIQIIPWSEKFWVKEPDYIIVEWEKNHRFTKILDYYRENEHPVWAVVKNGAIVTGIYKFNDGLDYNKILNN